MSFGLTTFPAIPNFLRGLTESLASSFGHKGMLEAHVRCCGWVTIAHQSGNAVLAAIVLVLLSVMMREQKITLGEMRANDGPRLLIVYCGDFKCSHSVIVSSGLWPDDVRLSDLEPRFTCKVCAGGERTSGRSSRNRAWAPSKNGLAGFRPPSSRHFRFRSYSFGALADGSRDTLSQL